MAVLNYATKYEMGLQQKFTNELKFAALYNTPNNALIRWSGANTFRIPNIETGGAVDVDRDALGTFGRNVDNKWQSLVMDHYREFRTLVDPQDIDETNMAVSIANITSVFNQEQKVPELDKFMASTLYAEVDDLSEINTDAVTEENILEVIDELVLEMDEAEVPEEGRYLYITPQMYKLLKNAEQISRKIETTTSTGSVNRAVKALEEMTIVTVPSSRMKSLYDFTEGAEADPAAKQINMILIHPRALYAPIKYEFVSVDEPSATTAGKHLYYESFYVGVFPIEKKIGAIQINAEA